MDVTDTIFDWKTVLALAMFVGALRVLKRIFPPTPRPPKDDEPEA